MGQMEHFSYGLLTPIVSYLMACTGAAIGLRCTVRALNATGSTRRNWLLMGATAIGSGIWTMHFIAMLGFGITGSSVRYDVPLTLLSLVVAIAVVDQPGREGDRRIGESVERLRTRRHLDRVGRVLDEEALQLV